MTALMLQDEIIADLTELFKDRRYESTYEKYAVPVQRPVTFAAQQLPKRQSEDEDDPFPYVIVRLDSGGIENQTSPHKVAVVLLAGVVDHRPENQGHRAVLEIIELIQRHYEESPLLPSGARFTDPFEWALQDEESYPYFFGAAKLSFELCAPRREGSRYT